MVLPDGTVVTGKTSERLGAASSLLMNALKSVTGVDMELEVIADEAGAAIEIIDPAPAIARRTASLLDRHGLRAERGHVPVYTFLSAAGVPYAERLRERASRL